MQLLRTVSILLLASTALSAQVSEGRKLEWSDPRSFRSAGRVDIAERYVSDAGDRLMVGSIKQIGCGPAQEMVIRATGGRVNERHTANHRLGQQTDIWIEGGKYYRTVVSTICSTDNAIMVVADITSSRSEDMAISDVGRVLSTLAYVGPPPVWRKPQPIPSGGGSPNGTVEGEKQAIRAYESTMRIWYGR